MKLYELTKDYLDVLAQLEEMDLDKETVQGTLDSIQAPIEEKVENIVKYMKSLEALADAKKLEAKRLSDSASSDLKKVEFYKQHITDNLNNANIKELQAGIFKVNFRKGSEVVKINEDQVPSYELAPWLYVPQEPKIMSKAELKRLVKDEMEIAGITIVRNPDTLQVK